MRVYKMKILAAALLVFVVSVHCHQHQQPYPAPSYNVDPKVLKPKGRMPVVGLGTFQSLDLELENALKAALDAGYRHIDTGTLYENEEAIGKVLKEWISSGKGKREDLFITTKLPYYGMRPDGVRKYLGQSLKKLQTDYVDMYLIHTPFGATDVDDPNLPSVLDKSTDLVAIWKAMEQEVDNGRAKAIGVSNFNAKQVSKILDHARIKPANLQIELHAYNQEKSLVEFAQKHGIVVTAYSPLGSPGSGVELLDPKTGRPLPSILKHPVVKEIAQRLRVSEAQVVLRHTLQKGVVVIPKSTNPHRLKNNLSLFNFKLDDADVKRLDALDLGEAGRLLDLVFFPEIKDHPEYPF